MPLVVAVGCLLQDAIATHGNWGGHRISERGLPFNQEHSYVAEVWTTGKVREKVDLSQKYQVPATKFTFDSLSN